MYWYILVCTGMYWYVEVWNIASGRQTVLYTRLWGNTVTVKPQRYILVYWYILVHTSMHWYIQVHTCMYWQKLLVD
jgi:hypothetical protein